MPSGTRKSKCKFRRAVASERISEAALNIAEGLLARCVARAYAAEHSDLFFPEGSEPPRGPVLSSAALPLSAQASNERELEQYE